MDEMDELLEGIELCKKQRNKYLRRFISALIFYVIGYCLMAYALLNYDTSTNDAGNFLLFLILAIFCWGIYPFIFAYKIGKETDDEYNSNHYVTRITSTWYGAKATTGNTMNFMGRFICSVLSLGTGIIVTPICIIFWIVGYCNNRKAVKELTKEYIDMGGTYY